MGEFLWSFDSGEEIFFLFKNQVNFQMHWKALSIAHYLNYLLTEFIICKVLN